MITWTGVTAFDALMNLGLYVVVMWGLIQVIIAIRHWTLSQIVDRIRKNNHD